jgi:mRNA-degrading endonuclease RelE of RelBE toxin-antitoxin system
LSGAAQFSFQAVIPPTAPIHPPERVPGPPELHHSKGRYLRGSSNRYKSKLRAAGFRLVYEVQDHVVIVWTAG